MKNSAVYTCYECPYYYADRGYRYPVKHCNQDHIMCPYYWGEGYPLEKENIKV